MSLRARFYLALSTSIAVIGIHLVAHDLYLYWTYRQIDILVHVLGGIMSAFYVLVALRYFKKAEIFKHVFLGVLAIGIGWEVLEIFYKVGEWDLYYWLDSSKDLIDDSIGGYIGYKIWQKLPEEKESRI